LNITNTTEDASAWTELGGYIMGGITHVLAGIIHDVSHGVHLSKIWRGYK